MLKIISSLIFVGLLLCSSALAETESHFDSLPANPDLGDQGLVNTNISTLSAKVNELERKVNDIERSRRFDQDRLRQLDRDVSDLKRRF